MIIKNKIEKTFGGPAIAAAVIFLVIGVLVIPLNGLSVGNILIGGLFSIAACFVIFTNSSVEIDTTKKQVKQFNNIFGIIKLGSRKKLEDYIGVTLVPYKKVQAARSMSNRTTSVVKKDYRIFLVNKMKKPAFAIKRCLNLEEAQNSLDEFAIWLKMPVYSIKRKY